MGKVIFAFFKQVKCVFITDGLIQDQVQRNLTIQERNRYKDIELQPLRGGREFGFRYLNDIKWAMAKFVFRYLLRMEDDYFLCLAQNESTMLCHPHADQQIGLWLNKIFRKTFFHDTRLHDHPPASFTRTFDKIKNVCGS